MTDRQKSEFANRLTVLLPHAIAWPLQQSEIVIKSGEPLNARSLQIAPRTKSTRAHEIDTWPDA